jgi:DNA-binding beta-propeller fold protein YncE
MQFCLEIFHSMIKGLTKQIFVLVFIIVPFCSCSKKFSAAKDTEGPVIYPAPPDTTRVQYLTSITTSTDIKGKQSAFNKYIFGEEVPKPVIKPYGVTVHGSKIYICDSGLGGLILIDLAKKSFEYFIPEGRGQLKLPLNCSVDSDGSLFVADGNRQQVVVYDKDGRYISEFGEKGENFKPTDVLVFENKVFVASVKDRKIYIYNLSGDSLLHKFPSSEPGDDGYLYQPVNISSDRNNIYVSDMGENKIKVFSPEGKFIRSVGGYGTYPGQLMRPKGISVDSESNLFVVDAAFENVQIFNREGKVLMSFGGPYNKHGDMWLPADVAISYTGLEFFTNFVDKSFNLKYLIFVTNQYGPDKIGVYGFVEPKK